eukprot:9082-Heterococcus_DN1.PRE.3
MPYAQLQQQSNAVVHDKDETIKALRSENSKLTKQVELQLQNALAEIERLKALIPHSPTAATATTGATGAHTGKWHIGGKCTAATGASSTAFDTIAKRSNAYTATDDKSTFNSGISSSSSSSSSKPVRGIPYSVERTVFVHNLPLKLTERDLMSHMERNVGKINSLNIHIDEQGFCKGTAYVDYASAAHASTAILHKNDSILNGRRNNVVVYRLKSSSVNKLYTIVNYAAMA